MMRKSTAISLLIILLRYLHSWLFSYNSARLEPATTDQLPTSTDSPTLMNLSGKSIYCIYHVR